MAVGVHKITEEFEKAISDYTGAPYVIALDNMSNALFLALTYEDIKGKEIWIPKHTYPSVPCEIIHAGGVVKWKHYDITNDGTLTGPYFLFPTCVVDSALRFTADMYIPGTHTCVSFTGPYKHLKLSKGGAILTDDLEAYKWFKKARFSGRDECSYHDDDFDVNPVIGWNYYMMPEIAARGLLMMSQFYDIDGNKLSNPDLTLKYPDLSKFKIYNNGVS